MVGVQILLLNDIFLSLNSLNSVKTFRKNSIKVMEISFYKSMTLFSINQQLTIIPLNKSKIYNLC